MLGSARRFLLNRLDRPAVVLLYHRVTNLETDPQQLSVSPVNFYEQIDHLRKTHTLMPVEEFYQHLLQRKKMPRKAALVTFDDGYADNLHEALPILETLDCQALFYITTSNLDTDRELWWDELERILLKQQHLPGSITITVKGKKMQYDLSSSSSRFNAYQSLQPLLRFMPPNERDQALEQVRRSAGITESGRPNYRMLTHKELLQLSRSPAAVIGAHTHNHPSLAALSYEEQLEEMNRSKNILEKILSTRIGHVSYPYGSKKDYNQHSIRACREAGFKMACANFYGQAHSWTDLYQVPRVLVRNWDRSYFIKYLSTCFAY